LVKRIEWPRGTLGQCFSCAFVRRAAGRESIPDLGWQTARRDIGIVVIVSLLALCFDPVDAWRALCPVLVGDKTFGLPRSVSNVVHHTQQVKVRV
jgi:hypothetical protein